MRRALRPPYETPSVVAVNGLLMTACWALLPPGLVSLLFRFHGPLAFPMVLAIWMYSDVPATNLLGGDPERSVTALADPPTLRRLWYAKNVVLWLLATPVCVLAAIWLGVVENRLVSTVLTVLWIAVVPLGALGFAGWLGIWFPYHPLPLRYRWERRRDWWRMLVRWLMLLVAPYGLVPSLALLVTLPSLLLWWSVPAHGTQDSQVSDAAFGLGLALGAATAIAAWLVGHWCGPRLANRRRRWLTAFLTDPDRG
jgi:hypothetical protein